MNNDDFSIGDEVMLQIPCDDAEYEQWSNEDLCTGQHGIVIEKNKWNDVEQGYRYVYGIRFIGFHHGHNLDDKLNGDDANSGWRLPSLYLIRTNDNNAKSSTIIKKMFNEMLKEYINEC